MYLHLHIAMEEQLNDILQSFLNAVALHDALHAADLLLRLFLLQPVLVDQPFVSLAQIVNDLLDGAVLLMQIRAQQVEDFLVLLVGNAASLVFKLVVLGQQFRLDDAVGLLAQAGQVQVVAEVQPVDVEEPAAVLKFIEGELLPNLFDPVIAYHPRALTAPVIFEHTLVVVASLEMPPAQPAQTLEASACEVVEVLQNTRD